MRRRALSAVAAAALFLVGAPPAGAQVVGGCTILTNLTTGINFGNYDPLTGSPVSVVWPVSFYCPYGQAGYAVAFSAGNSGNPHNRYMSDALTEKLNYNIYQDGANTIIWGDGTNGTQPYVGAASSQTNYTIDVYAYLPGGQKNVSAYQAFSDTIVATITF